MTWNPGRSRRIRLGSLNGSPGGNPGVFFYCILDSCHDFAMNLQSNCSMRLANLCIWFCICKMSEKGIFVLFCPFPMAKGKPSEALFSKGLRCGSNRTRTYDTPGMNRAVAIFATSYFTTVQAFTFASCISFCISPNSFFILSASFSSLASETSS